MLQQDAQIINKLGLHARASAKLTQLASQFPCEVWLTRNDRRINAKSIMGVMMLAAGIGSSVQRMTRKIFLDMDRASQSYLLETSPRTTEKIFSSAGL